MLSKKQLSFLALIFISIESMASNGKVDLMAGYFNINAKSGNNRDSIGSPSAIKLGYSRPVMNKLELNIAYTMLMIDFSGSDLGYGLNLGGNYYFMSTPEEDTFKNNEVDARRFDSYSPYAGLGFYQRQFQSIKNSYAGLGVNAGLEIYHSRKINWKIEARYISLTGSGDSSAVEVNLLAGIVYKL